jgi:hypothetical protein
VPMAKGMECDRCLGTKRCHICGGRARSSASGIPTACLACAGTGRCRACSTLAAVPTQRGARTAAEVGTVAGTGVLHAACKTLAGPKAVCGAGPLTPHTGRFDPDDAETCPDCLAR